MRKISIALMLSVVCIYTTHAQTSDLLTGSGVTLQTKEDVDGHIGIGLNTLSSYEAAIGIGNFSYQGSTPPSILAAIVNKVTATWPAPGISDNSLVVLRSDGSGTHDPLIDFIVTNDGSIGFGAPPAYIGPYGSNFGIVNTNNASALPLFSAYTNTNNSSGINLPALIMDYDGSIMIGCGTGITGPARLNLTSPFPSGTIPLLSVFTNAGAQSLFVDVAGNVGIGTTTPAQALQVVGTTVTTNLKVTSGATSGYVLQSDGSGNGTWVDPNSLSSSLWTASGSDIYNANSGNVKVNGKLQIGSVPISSTSYSTLASDYSLYVEKGIIAEKYKCAVHTTSDWSDYVFDKGYKLAPLSDVEAYIKANKHLAGVPSAEDVHCEGIDMAQMDATLLKKIEELTLYVLELKKDNEAMKVQLNNIKR